MSFYELVNRHLIALGHSEASLELATPDEITLARKAALAEMEKDGKR